MRNPVVPEVLDGWYILHRLFRFERRAFLRLDQIARERLWGELEAVLTRFAVVGESDSAAAHILGHKGDLMLTHYARTLDGLAEAEKAVDALAIAEFLLPTTSYVSVLELGLYEATAAMHRALHERGLVAQSPEWNTAFDALVSEQATAPRNAARLFAAIPTRPYVCFYPMDKRRGEATNWYMLSYDERIALMRDHGRIGRSYHGQVTQVISGSIGFDDFEWGVDLYADDPTIFKKLIYEMRFDEASAKYGVFGSFYIGRQIPIAELGTFFTA